ncbi:MAG: sensor histidine kinase [Candidatus Hodarchaeales archaeon]
MRIKISENSKSFLKTYIKQEGYQSISELFEIFICQLETKATKSELLKESHQIKWEEKKTRITSVVIHDINNYTTALSGYLELIKELGSSDELIEHVNNAQDQLTVINMLLENLNEILSNLSSRMPMYKLDLKTFFSIIAKEINQMFPSRKITVEINSKENFNPLVKVDLLLNHVFLNLFSNAVRHGRKNDINVLVQLEREKNEIIINVEDNGIGIPKEIAKNLFESPLKRDRKGLNGLYIIKEIIDCYGGNIKISDERSKLGGAKFVVTMPHQSFEISSSFIDL